MLKFLVYEDGKPAEQYHLRNVCLIGSDGNAMRSDVSFDEKCICCEKRETGPAALALQYKVGELGELTLQTCLLPDRDQPYLLSLELARHRMMTLYSKQEEWAMFDLDPAHPVSKRVERAQALFIDALCMQDHDPGKASLLAQESLQAAVDGSEELALAHSDILLKRRILSNSLPKCPIGCGIGFELSHERLRAALAANFDYVQLPTAWKALTPEEGDHDWKQMDNWVDWATRSRLPIIAGPIISFTPQNLPDWLYIWEHDYDTVRDLIYEHVERLVNRYKNKIRVWNVVSGLHVNNHFTFNFEQLMDLTRTTTMLVKKIQPAAKVVVELRQPFGEYYGINQRSIPPMMYADLLVQSAISFDAFGIELLIGQAVPGQYTRDLMQMSCLLDQFAGLGKPMHVTIAVPSEPVTQMMITAPDSGEPVDPDCGYWRRPWSHVVQSHWLEAVFQIAMSKPFVDAVTWRDLCDYPDIELPLSGLLNEQLQPKNAFLRLAMFRRRLAGESQKRESQSFRIQDPPIDADESIDTTQVGN